MARKITTTLIICLSIFSLFSTNIYADSDSERENLARITKEIDFLIGEVNAIAKDAPANTRIQFRYDLLREDLIRMKQGISDHINGSLDASRPITPMNAVYRR